MIQNDPRFVCDSWASCCTCSRPCRFCVVIIPNSIKSYLCYFILFYCFYLPVFLQNFFQLRYFPRSAVIRIHGGQNTFRQWRIQGRGRWCDRPPPFGLTVNFYIIFALFSVGFVSRLNRKVRVPRLLVTVFCLLKTAAKFIQTYQFVRAAPPPHPLPSTPTAPRPILTEILSTPLLSDGEERRVAAVAVYYVKTLGKLFLYVRVHLSPSSILALTRERWCSVAGKVTVASPGFLAGGGARRACATNKPDITDISI